MPSHLYRYAPNPVRTYCNSYLYFPTTQLHLKPISNVNAAVPPLYSKQTAAHAKLCFLKWYKTFRLVAIISCFPHKHTQTLFLSVNTSTPTLFKFITLYNKCKTITYSMWFVLSEISKSLKTCVDVASPTIFLFCWKIIRYISYSNIMMMKAHTTKWRQIKLLLLLLLLLLLVLLLLLLNDRTVFHIWKNITLQT
jgi:hypothetical protein